MKDLKFEMDAAISVSEMRHEETWRKRLGRFKQLRVERRGRGESGVVGVLVSPERWRAIAASQERLEAQLEALEDEVASRIIEEREGAPLLQGRELSAAVSKRLKQRSLL
ncbi:hypothetical protein EPN52_14445 [bacterium]|nr:MAG: hypothetical protein EPN52_14445 [bacterium]